jgi:8-oxo-dGTP diphosphatase
VLLLRGGPHKRLWAGRYNGVGGHVERGEDISTAARREISEETGLTVRAVRLRGVIHVDAGDPAAGVLIFVFTAAAESRVTHASPEGTLAWWPVGDLPLDELVEDLPALLPCVLGVAGDAPPWFARYHYDESDRLVIAFAEAR